MSLFPAQHHPCLPVAPSPGSGDGEAQPVVALPGDTLRPFGVGSGSRRHASGCRGSAARGETRAAFRGCLLPRSTTDPRGCWGGGGGLQPVLGVADPTWILWMLGASSSGPVGRSMGRRGSWSSRSTTLLGRMAARDEFRESRNGSKASSAAFRVRTCRTVAVHDLPLAWLGWERAQPWCRRPNSLLCLCGGALCCELDRSRRP